ncbi:MAG: hypothetical protein AB1486_26380 [Planctomycetota bacterium]
MTTRDAPVLNDPALARRLFWDCETAQIDLDAQADFVLGRSLEYGTLVAVRWCLEFYGRERIARFLRTRGLTTLSRKTLRFWVQLLGLEGEECFQTSSLASKRAFWNY